MEPASERVASIFAFKIISRVKQVLTACLSLAASQSAKAVEAPGDGGDKTPFTFDISGYGPKERRGCLVGTIGAAQTLYGIVGPPARLEQEMHAPLLVLYVQIGMIGPACPACVRKYKHALLAVHKALSFD